MEVSINMLTGVFLVLSKHCILQPKIAVRFCPNSDKKCHGSPEVGKELEQILAGW